MAVKNLRVAQGLITGLQQQGKSDEDIVKALLKSPAVDNRVKSRLQGIQSAGLSSKAVQDLSSLKTEDIVSKKDFEIKGKLGTVGRFLGAEKLGRFLGSQAARFDPTTRQIQRTLSERGETGTVKTLQRGGVSGRELAGSIAQTGLSLAGGTALRALGKVPGLASRTLTKTGILGAGIGGAEAAQREGASITRGALTGGLVGVGTVGAARTLSYVGSRYPKLLGIFTGESTDVVEAAIRNPKAAEKALDQGDKALRNFVDRGARKSVKLRDAAINGHSAAMKQISSKAKSFTAKKTDLVNNFKELLKTQDVSIARNGKLDFTGSPIIANAGEVSKINTAWNALRKKGTTLSFEDINKFRRVVGKLTRFADDAGIPAKSPTLAKFYHNINEITSKTLPKAARKQYLAANKKFSTTIDTLDDIVDAFHKGSPFRRLSGVMGDKADDLRELMQFYQKKTGEDILATVAGRELGAERRAAFGFLNPRSWIDLFISPPAQARLTIGFGRGAEAVRKGVKATGRFLTREVGR